jgi:hypothetical protein
MTRPKNTPDHRSVRDVVAAGIAALQKHYQVIPRGRKPRLAGALSGGAGGASLRAECGGEKA